MTDSGRRSPARNRVTPLGDIEAFPLRGAWTGNRGIIHPDREIVRFHASDLWITCALEFRGWWREQWLPHRWTHLFFHDEAVSFAAGHRPCAECRRADYLAYRDGWAAALEVPRPLAKEINRQLHGERVVRGTHRRRVHDMDFAGLPDGTFVLIDGTTPALVLDDASGGVDTVRLCRPHDPPATWPRDRDHAAVDGGRPPDRLSGPDRRGRAARLTGRAARRSPLTPIGPLGPAPE